MWWSEPLWLLGLFFIAPLFWIGGFALGRFKPLEPKGLPVTKSSRNLKLITGLRVAAVALVIFALAGTYVWLPTYNQQTVIILDVSESIGPSQIEEARDAALEYIRRMPDGDRVAVVAFSEKPVVLTPLIEPRAALQVLETACLVADSPERSNLQAALRVGFELLNGQYGNRRILFFTDGRPTEGAPIMAFLNGLDPARTPPIFSIPIGLTSIGITGKGLEIPELIYPGEKIPVQWRVSAGIPQKTPVRIKVDGKLTATYSINLAMGNNSIALKIPPQPPGTHRLEVDAITKDGQAVPQSFTGGMFKVSGPAKILLLYDQQSEAALGRALRMQGMAVEEKSLAALGEAPEALDDYSTVILDNVPAPYISPRQQLLLRHYVAGGGGLLVIGGESSLGRGEYYASQLEEMLPVETDTRQRLIFNRAMILFVIDQSGSMSELVGKTTKLAAVLQGVAAALEELNPRDEVGLLAFDSTPTWVLPFTPAAKKTQIMNALAQVGSVGGGTDMGAAMREIINWFSISGPVRRHVVFLTDGNTGDGNFEAMSKQLKKLGVTITTIGVGEEINQALLENIARWGEGKFYRADLDKIPQIYQKEMIRVTRDLIQEGLFYPKIQTPAAFLDDLTKLAPNLPPLRGYLVAKPKSFATVYLHTGNAAKNDPLLVAWRYGNGQVAVFTSDSGRRWLAPWAGTQAYNLLWSRVVRLLERSNPAPGLRVSAQVEGDNADIVAEATGPDNRLQTGLFLTGRLKDEQSQPFNLIETAPGRYEASVHLPGSGIRQFEIYNSQSREWVAGWVWKPPGVEFSEPGPDLELLRQVSALTGGAVVALNELRPAPRSWSWAPYNLKTGLVILALLLLVIELGYRSVSLGQMKMAGAVFKAWWSTQMRLIELVREAKAESKEPERGHKQTMDAYRYLAERAKREKESLQ
ncbi:MAG: VWA domain-containing protein [Firmicutes bacterium]|nr:VWA domain-containing protein [Bacillota bacterium]